MSETICHNLEYRARYERDAFFVARLTPIGRGGVSCVGVSGAACVDALFRRLRHAPMRGDDAFADVNRPHFVRFKISEREEVFEEVVLRRRSASVYEIDCHGGDLVTSRIVEYFVETGAKSLSANEWERMVERHEALDAVELNNNCSQASKLTRGILFEESTSLEDLFFARMSELIGRASSEDTARIACDQRDAWRRFLEKLVSDLRALSFSELDSDHSQLVQVLNEVLLRRAWGRRLFEPFVVVLLGAPNVGKSSLFNALLGYDRSVVSSEEGTTRDLVGATALLKGWAFRIVDAAGLRETSDQVEREGVECARRLSSDADLILCCYDASKSREEQDAFWNRALQDDVFPCVAKTLKILNKSDLLDSNTEKKWAHSDFVLVSALLRQGLERLVDQVYQRTVGELTSFSDRSDDLPLLWTQDQATFLRSVRDLCVERRFQDALKKLGAT